MSLETLKPKVAELIEKAQSGGNTDELEAIIDNSGVLESTEGTIEDKVEQLVDKAEDERLWYMRSTEASDRFGTGLFHSSYLTKLPKLDLSKNTNLSNFCTYAKIERIDQYLNTESCSVFSNAFSGTSELTYMKGICTKNAAKVNSMFYDSAIIEIELPFDFSNVQSGYSSAFVRATALVEVRFETETIKVSTQFSSAVLSIGNVFDLNDTENVGSVQSIINGLATLAEGAAAQTLTLSKNLPLTDEQKQAITTAVNNKGWTLAFG